MWEFLTKGLQSIAMGKAAGGGLQSPHLPGAIVRLGRFFYCLTGGWIAVCWYTGYVNARTEPGGGPKLILPGKPVIGTVDRSDRTPRFAASANTGTTSPGGNNNSGNVGTDLYATGGAVRLKAVRIARAYVGRSNFRYSETRPMPQSLNSNPCVTDCSGFVTLVYKMAGAGDPNGFGYNGSGYTGTLEKQGVAVKRPNLADLAFWRNPDHVAIVVGTGTDPQIVEFGAPPSPIITTVSTESRGHQAFLGFRSYLDAPAAPGPAHTLAVHAGAG